MLSFLPYARMLECPSLEAVLPSSPCMPKSNVSLLPSIRSASCFVHSDISAGAFLLVGNDSSTYGGCVCWAVAGAEPKPVSAQLSWQILVHMLSFRRAALKQGLAILAHATNLTLVLTLDGRVTPMMVLSGLAAIQSAPDKLLENE